MLSLEIQRLTKVSECNSYKDILTGFQKSDLYHYRDEYFTETCEPIEVSIAKKCSMFYTITFSPKRFYEHTDDQYKAYILYHIGKMYVDDIIWYAYGCFEYHKSGVIHAHVVISSYNHDIVKKILNKSFNHDARNRKCIDASFVQSEDKTLNYLHKTTTPEQRSNHFFKLGEIPNNNINPPD